ncbi:hypothetical protein ACKKBG_A14935 [Auxenochlorella protothecoides x Auxenochlorella symbiontica]
MKRTRSVSVVVTDGGLEEARAKLSQRSRFRLAILNVLPEPWLICGASLIIVVALALVSLTLFPYSLAAAGVGSSPAQGVSATLRDFPVPRVALMFLVRGPMPHEGVWADFLRPATVTSSPAAVTDLPWRHFFSLYTHPSPNWTYPATSLFAGTEVPGREQVAWGQHSLIVAERRLLAAALGDPRNARFLLASESCVPLWPRESLYLAAMGHERSFINACRNLRSAKQARQQMVDRYQPGMAIANVTEADWRKSAQWFMLTRRHAFITVTDTVVEGVFRKECYVGKDRFCVSDEHYIPTLLAHLGLANETNCRTSVAYTSWGPPSYAHPKTLGPADATPAKVYIMRGSGCTSNATADAAALLAFLRQCHLSEVARQTPDYDDEPMFEEWLRGSLAVSGHEHIPAWCHLTARKMAPAAADAWRAVLSPMHSRGEPRPIGNST